MKAVYAVGPNQVKQTDVLILFGEAGLLMGYQPATERIRRGLVMVGDEDLGRRSLFGQDQLFGGCGVKCKRRSF